MDQLRRERDQSHAKLRALEKDRKHQQSEQDEIQSKCAALKEQIHSANEDCKKEDGLKKQKPELFKVQADA